MRRSSLYTWFVSRSSAAGSPPLQAFSKPVTSMDRVGTVAVLQKKIPRPWPLFPPASACSGGGAEGDENHGRGGDGGDGWDHGLGGCSSGGRAAGNGLHSQHGGHGVGEPGQDSFVCYLRGDRRENPMAQPQQLPRGSDLHHFLARR